MSTSRLHQRLLLIGYRGTGKTTVATQLADKTDSQWIDTDTEIIRLADCSIEKLFEREGEAGFRNRETSVLRGVLATPCPIIACGGGIVLREDNRKLLEAAGITVLLQASPETLYARIQQDGQSQEQRPPLTNLTGKEEIEAILNERKALYDQCATIIVDTETKTAEQVAEEILKHLQNEAQSEI